MCKKTLKNVNMILQKKKLWKKYKRDFTKEKKHWKKYKRDFAEENLEKNINVILQKKKTLKEILTWFYRKKKHFGAKNIESKNPLSTEGCFQLTRWLLEFQQKFWLKIKIVTHVEFQQKFWLKIQIVEHMFKKKLCTHFILFHPPSVFL